VLQEVFDSFYQKYVEEKEAIEKVMEAWSGLSISKRKGNLPFLATHNRLRTPPEKQKGTNYLIDCLSLFAEGKGLQLTLLYILDEYLTNAWKAES
jgi:hypothetical protein